MTNIAADVNKPRRGFITIANELATIGRLYGVGQTPKRFDVAPVLSHAIKAEAGRDRGDGKISRRLRFAEGSCPREDLRASLTKWDGH